MFNDKGMEIICQDPEELTHVAEKIIKFAKDNGNFNIWLRWGQAKQP